MSEPGTPFSLAIGDRLIREDGSYLAVVASALITGVPSVIVQSHTATGERAPHPNKVLEAAGMSDGHYIISLHKIEKAVASGTYTVGHAPVS